VILSVICSGVANGLGRVAVVAEPVEAAVVVVVLPTITYPMIGEALKSSVIVDMIRFSADLTVLLSPAIL
jgi:hypothetical protein